MVVEKGKKKKKGIKKTPLQSTIFLSARLSFNVKKTTSSIKKNLFRKYFYWGKKNHMMKLYFRCTY